MYHPRDARGRRSRPGGLPRARPVVSGAGRPSRADWPSRDRCSVSPRSPVAGRCPCSSSSPWCSPLGTRGAGRSSAAGARARRRRRRSSSGRGSRTSNSPTATRSPSTATPRRRGCSSGGRRASTSGPRTLGVFDGPGSTPAVSERAPAASCTPTGGATGRSRGTRRRPRRRAGCLPAKVEALRVRQSFVGVVPTALALAGIFAARLGSPGRAVRSARRRPAARSARGRDARTRSSRVRFPSTRRRHAQGHLPADGPRAGGRSERRSSSTRSARLAAARALVVGAALAALRRRPGTPADPVTQLHSDRRTDGYPPTSRWRRRCSSRARDSASTS